MMIKCVILLYIIYTLVQVTAQGRSTTASNSRNSDRNGLGIYKHFLTVQQDMPGDGPEATDSSSEHSTQQTLSISERNDIFLKCTEFDSKGIPYGMGQLSQVQKGKRKIRYAESSSSSLVEIQEELKSARQKIAENEAENQRRDEALRQSQARQQSQLAAYMSDSSALDPSATANPSQPPPAKDNT
ncbi:unnamed protein product [Arabis nemorensis]|uniref:Secreted protein n=1 Tax=Arabis nemorensis TaxID=586526 RepID=A0A565BAI8_9BRAS|nr:unnamed protein product [Arabis nemorensis]